MNSIYIPNKTKHQKIKKAMFLCVEGEQHYFGLKMASGLFKEHGWNVKFFGPNLPLEYAMNAAASWKPEIICISVSIVYHLVHLKEYIEAFESMMHHPTVIVGSRLIKPYHLEALGSSRTIFINNFIELQDWLFQNSAVTLKQVGREPHAN